MRVHVRLFHSSRIREGFGENLITDPQAINWPETRVDRGHPGVSAGPDVC